MQNDVKFLSEKLGKIEGYGDVGDKLLAIIKTKRADIAATKGVEDARKAAEATKAAEAAKAADSAQQSNGTSKDDDGEAGGGKAEDDVQTQGEPGKGE